MYIHKGHKQGKFATGTIGVMCFRVNIIKYTKSTSTSTSTLRNDYVTCPVCLDIIKEDIKNPYLFSNKEILDGFYNKNSFLHYNKITRVYSFRSNDRYMVLMNNCVANSIISKSLSYIIDTANKSKDISELEFWPSSIK